jgi:hypothetical protein
MGHQFKFIIFFQWFGDETVEWAVSLIILLVLKIDSLTGIHDIISIYFQLMGMFFCWQLNHLNVTIKHRWINQLTDENYGFGESFHQ